MFNKNDKFLMIAKIVFFVILIAIAVIVLLEAIMYFVANQILAGFIVLITGLVILAVYAFVIPLVLSVLVDIKHIRNKLYNVEQKELDNYWEGYTGILPFVFAGSSQPQQAEKPAADERDEKPAEAAEKVSENEQQPADEKPLDEEEE